MSKKSKIRRLRADPRTRAQVRADADVLTRFRHGKALVVPPRKHAAAMKRVRARNAARRKLVEKFGLDLGVLRREIGCTQAFIAAEIGTKNTNISAIERGRAPGISLERFLAIIEVLQARAQCNRSGTLFSPTRGFRRLTDCLQT